jgi:glucose/arabinose dehydrogenase
VDPRTDGFLKVLTLVAAAITCGGGIVNPPPPRPGTPALRLVSGVLASPVYVTAPPGDTARLFVVEKGGRVRILQHDTLLAAPFLDIHTRVSNGGEQGLLSLAFHPQYARNGRFYVYYTNTAGDTRVVRYRVSADPNVADPLAADTVLAQAQPFSNHNGGLLVFGPDGKLYVGLGDGGSGGDPQGNGQSRRTLLGKILRLDVDGANGYTIPADNPFVSDTAARPEIWAYGLRNPWRFSFDRQTGDLYIADVGQNAWEEVHVAPATSGRGKGVNFGWNVMEGLHCYPSGTSCNQTGLALPVLAYGHGGGACSITGGYVYRGTAVPSLVGHYLYADYCSGFVRSFRYAGGQASDRQERTAQLNPNGNVSSFGEDGRGEVYVMTLGGSLYRVVETP